jgi:Flp pilus assembly protein TadD
VLAVASVPALVLASEVNVNGAVSAYNLQDCDTAKRKAQTAIDRLGRRSEPWQILALCEARAGRYDASVGAFRRAIDRDPRSWRLHASLAGALAAAGRDPQSAIRRVAQLNPRGTVNAELVRAFPPGRRSGRRRAGREYLESRGYQAR